MNYVAVLANKNCKRIRGYPRLQRNQKFGRNY